MGTRPRGISTPEVPRRLAVPAGLRRPRAVRFCLSLSACAGQVRQRHRSQAGARLPLWRGAGFHQPHLHGVGADAGTGGSCREVRQRRHPQDGARVSVQRGSGNRQPVRQEVHRRGCPRGHPRRVGQRQRPQAEAGGRGLRLRGRTGSCQRSALAGGKER